MQTRKVMLACYTGTLMQSLFPLFVPLQTKQKLPYHLLCDPGLEVSP